MTALVDAQGGALGAADPGEPGRRFLRVYDEHMRFVFRNARRMGIADDAVEDVVQETFLVVHRRMAEFEGRSSVRTWLFGILLRVVADHRRTHRRKHAHSQGGVDLEALADRGPAPDASTEQSQAIALLDSLLGELPDDKRAIFALAELEHMTVPEIADVLGINVNTVYSRLRLARKSFEEAVVRYRARTAHLQGRSR